MGSTSQTVDSLSRVDTTTDAKGQAVHYTYDILDRLTSVTYPVHSDVAVIYDYDAAGNVTQRWDLNGVTNYQIDSLNRLTSETRSSSTVASYSYDGIGNVITFTDPSGTITYEYDDANQLISLEEPIIHGPRTTTFEYDEDGNRIETAYPNGVVQTAEIDDAGRLLEIAAHHGSNTLTQFTYSYLDGDGDDTSLRQSVTDVHGVTTDYAYDRLSRLSGAERSTSSATLDTWSYTYDLASNRTTAVHNGTPTQYTYNGANQLISSATSTSNTVTYTYDANGNLTGSSDGLSLSYNSANQTLAIDTGSNLAEFAYAGNTQVERTLADGTTIHNTAAGVTRAGDDAYTRDTAGTLIGLRKGANTERYHYLFDGLGSVVGLTNSNGQLVNTYEYDPYGQTLNSTELVDNPWQFTGEWHDETTGMYKIGHRYYNPDHGRWTQQDVLNAPLDPNNANRYAYAAANPINYTDPTGTVTKAEALEYLGLALGVGSVVLSGPWSIGFAIASFAVNTIAGGMSGGAECAAANAGYSLLGSITGQSMAQGVSRAIGAAFGGTIEIGGYVFTDNLDAC